MAGRMRSRDLHGGAYPTNLLFGSPSLPFGATPQDSFRVTTTWDGSTVLRGGRLLTPSTLFYMSGGLAWAHIQVTSTCSPTPTANVSNCAPGNYFSGTLGPVTLSSRPPRLAGRPRWALRYRFWSNWVARGQYRFSGFDYQADRMPLTLRPRELHWLPFCREQPAECLFSVPMMQHLFEFGIAYKFGTSVQATDLPVTPSSAPIPSWPINPKLDRSLYRT